MKTVRCLFLQVTGPDWQACAAWEQHGSQWKCVSAGPRLGWMRGATTQAVADTLENSGLPFEWIDLGRVCVS